MVMRASAAGATTTAEGLGVGEGAVVGIAVGAVVGALVAVVPPLLDPTAVDGGAGVEPLPPPLQAVSTARSRMHAHRETNLR